MIKHVAAPIGLVKHVFAQTQPPQILQVYRDFLKAGSDAAYERIEQDAQRICFELKCPHPYVGIESLALCRPSGFQLTGGGVGCRGSGVLAVESAQGRVSREGPIDRRQGAPGGSPGRLLRCVLSLGRDDSYVLKGARFIK